ncbi:ABC transporter permease [Bacteroides sp.]|uniref:ABC transporter permease n=1 Tax=Bacteroides sp. TaxID=29523 RepID=UPI002582B50E|nr:ABC transporter permease [Bacteroides sp.]
MNKRFIVFLSSRKSWTLPYIIFSAIFVIIPLFLIVVYAFTDDSGHLTLANFQKFFEHPEAINTFVYSIGIAIITTLVCILLGYPAAWILSNSKLNRSKTMVVLFILPMWVNILVRTLATVALFDFFSVPLGEGALIFGMVYNFIPFMIYPIYNTLQKMDHSYIEAAQDLGATPMQALWKVIIPEIRPGMISGFMLALTLSIDDFAVTVFTIGNQGLETLSTYIYADARKGGLTPELRPLSAIIFVVVLALLVVINYRAGKTKKKD